MTVLDIKPGDKILIRSGLRMTRDDRDWMKEVLGEYFPGHEVLILDGGLSLGVVRPDGEDAQADPGPYAPVRLDGDAMARLADSDGFDAPLG
jgi:hypothetical protein